MKKVLVAIGTSHFDPHDLCDALLERGVECTIRHWNAVRDPPGHYDLAVLFGLTEYRAKADLYAGTVRAAIGGGTPLVVVSSWSPAIMALHMKEKFNAEYQTRHGPIQTLLDTVLKMLQESKTAPC
jgi:hypothetical protein